MIIFTIIGSASPGIHIHQHNTTDMPSIRKCSLTELVPYAHCVENYHHLTCWNGITVQWLHHSTTQKVNITHLSLISWSGDCIDASQLQQTFPEVQQLALVNSTKLLAFTGQFGKTSKIEKLLVNGMTSLLEVPAEVVQHMHHLRELDLRGNILRHLKAGVVLGPPKLKKVFLSNNKWDCSDGGLNWLAMETDNGTARRRIVDYNYLTCNHHLYMGKPLHKVMDIIRMVNLTCPEPCFCLMTHVVSNRAGEVIPLITVNCSNRKLTSPPTALPPSTSTLRLEGNKISSIHMITQNAQYQRLADLYLDNNSISSVKELEGSEWFSTFRVLSLRGNELRQIPVYAFDKAFQSNNNIMNVFLGHNPWRCDCHYTPRFKTLLLKYTRVIKDLTDIRCSLSDNKDTSLVQISKISLASVCRSDVEMPISVVNIVNLVLMLAISLVIGRFLYDRHVFMSTGKLPWLSTIWPRNL